MPKPKRCCASLATALHSTRRRSAQTLGCGGRAKRRPALTPLLPLVIHGVIANGALGNMGSMGVWEVWEI